MKQYLGIVRQVLDEGESREDRTGVGTWSLFGLQARYDLREGFPIVTTKKVSFSTVCKELLWFLSGSTNINEGLDCSIWNEWADKNGDLGPIYGYQWRRAGGRDQLREVIDRIKHDPQSRRLIVSAWNVDDVPKMALPPCHTMFQFYVSGGHLDLQLYQRSADLALGVPFNIASYSLLLSLVAKECCLTPRYFIHTLGDAHVYKNHVEGLRQQLEREPFPLPRLVVESEYVDDARLEDLSLVGYQHHPAIHFRVAV